MDKWNGFKGEGKKIEDVDISRLAHFLGVGEDEMHAVLDVETSGSGFDSKGRPKMLFEPHIFYAELGEGTKRTAAVKQGLAYAKWKKGAYPKDSYPRLERAMAIDEAKALRSASWGLGQVMGFNYQAAGYSSVQAMVRAFMDDEEDHLAAMANFIKSKGIDDDLKAHRWDAFARVYNGEGYAKNGYHTKLAARFKWWQGKKDTPFVAPARLPGIAEQKEPVMTTKPSDPSVFDLIVKAATTAAMSVVEGGKGTTADVIGKAVSETLTAPPVVDAAAATSKAVTSMPAKKPWWQSMGVLGGVATVVASVAGFAGISATGGDVEELMMHGTMIVTAITGIIAIIGRVRARRQVNSGA